MTHKTVLAGLLALSPFMMAANGKGCAQGGDAPDGAGSFDGQTPATGNPRGTPDVRGEWAISWQDDLEVEITIGGSTYTETLGPQGGLVTLDHNGRPFTFDLDCSREVIVCPSEVWPTSVHFDQDFSAFPRNLYVTIPSHACDGELIDVDPVECGPEAETCQVCDGATTLSATETIGRMSFDNERIAVFLNAGLASNGANCVLLGLSVAAADLESTARDSGDYRGVALTNGRVVTGFGGGCMWVSDADADGESEALAYGAGITFTTHFTAQALGGDE